MSDNSQFSIEIPIEIKDRLTAEFDRISNAVKGKEHIIRDALVGLKNTSGETLDTIRTKIEALDKAKLEMKQLDALKTKLKEVTGHTHDAGHEVAGLTEHFELVNGKLKTFINFANIAGAAVLEIAGVHILLHQVEELAEYGEAIEKAGQKTGLTTDAIQELNYVAKLNGSSIEALIPSFKNLARTVESAAGGNKALNLVFKDMGVDIEAVKKGTISLDQVNTQVIEHLAGLGDKTRQLSEATKVYGKGALELLPIIAQGAEHFKEQRDRAHELGLVLGEEAIEKAAQMKERMIELNLVMESAKFQTITPLIGGMTQALEVLTGTVVGLKNIFHPLNDVMEESEHTLGFWGTILQTVADIVELTGIGLVGLKLIFDSITQFLGSTAAEALNLFGHEWERLGADIEFVATVAKDTFNILAHPSDAKQGLESIQKAWEDFGKKRAAISQAEIADAKDFWQQYKDQAKNNLEDVSASVDAAGRSLDAIRKSLTAPEPGPKKSAPGAPDAETSTDTVTLEKELQAQLIKIKEAAAKASAAANLEGLQKEQADENASYTARLEEFKKFDAIAKTSGTAYHQAKEALEQEHQDNLLAIQEKADTKTLAEHEKVRQAADKLSADQRVAAAEKLIKDQEEMLKIQKVLDLDSAKSTESKYAQELAQSKAHFDELREHIRAHAATAIEADNAISQANALEEKKRSEITKLALQQTTSSILANLATALKAYKSFGTAYKVVAEAQNAIDTYGAATAAYKSAAEIPYVGYILGPLAAAAAIGAGIANGVQIARQHFEYGGIVQGSSTTGDKIPVMANAGEVFMNHRQQATTLMAIANGAGSGSDWRPGGHTFNINYAPSFPSSAMASGESLTEWARRDKVNLGRFWKEEMIAKGYV